MPTVFQNDLKKNKIKLITFALLSMDIASFCGWCYVLAFSDPELLFLAPYIQPPFPSSWVDVLSPAELTFNLPFFQLSVFYNVVYEIPNSVCMVSLIFRPGRGITCCFIKTHSPDTNFLSSLWFMHCYTWYWLCVINLSSHVSQDWDIFDWIPDVNIMV